MKSFAKVFQYISRQWPRALAYLAYNILGVLFSVLSFSMVIPFLRFLFIPEGDPPTEVPQGFSLSIEQLIAQFRYFLDQYTQEHGKMGGLIFITALLVLSTLLKNLFILLSNWALIPLRNTILRDLKRDVFHKTLYLPLSYFSRGKKGDMMTRLSVDITEVEHALVSGTQLLFKEPIYILTYLGVMFYISTKLTIFILLFLPVVGYLIGKVSKNLRSATVENQSSIGEQMSIVDESLSGLKIIKSYNIEPLQEEKYRKYNEEIYQLSNRINRRRDLASPLAEFLGVLVMAVIILYGGYLILGSSGDLSAEGFIGFIIMFSQIIPPLSRLSGFFYNLHKGRASLERLEDILESPSQESEEQGPEVPELQESIRYEDVSFSFPDAQILKNINLSIPKGKTIALVGESGSGKSTLVNLLSRFYEIQDGKISIDGQDIRQFGLAPLRSQIGIVSQEPVLFNDTIYNNINITQSQEEGIEDRVKEAARVAFADEFISQRPEGYESNVGDGGSKLSGGEKQRITIARAVLKDAPILILDEATSALDTVSENLVQRALENLKKNRTTIIIAHRLSTVKHADQIVVMKKGEIIEQGSHHDLMDLQGIYAQLVDMQELR